MIETKRWILRVLGIHEDLLPDLEVRRLSWLNWAVNLRHQQMPDLHLLLAGSRVGVSWRREAIPRPMVLEAILDDGTNFPFYAYLEAFQLVSTVILMALMSILAAKKNVVVLFQAITFASKLAETQAHLWPATIELPKGGVEHLRASQLRECLVLVYQGLHSCCHSGCRRDGDLKVAKG